jgi:hypothetical protein
MTTKRLGAAAAGVLAMLMSAFSAPAAVAQTNGVIYACANPGNGNLRMVAATEACHANETRVVLNIAGGGAAGPTGPAGPAGATGPTGPQGTQGVQGAPGVKGATGSTGANGAAGSPGAAGPTGPAGTNGIDGKDAPSGGISGQLAVCQGDAQSLSGLLVHVPGRAFSVFTGADGKFQIDGMPSETFTLSVERGGSVIATVPGIAVGTTIVALPSPVLLSNTSTDKNNCGACGVFCAGTCVSGSCQTTGASCTDNVKDQGETDVDCGGNTSCARCAVGKQCLIGTDCNSGVCSNGACQAAAPQCSQAADCGNSTTCVTYACTAGTCSTLFTASGTVVSDPVHGDCRSNVCDGAGNVVNSANNTDLPADDGNQCTQEVCIAGNPSHPNAPQGTACNQNGGNVCDGSGNCVQQQQSSCSNGIKDGNETDVDCGGSCPACSNGKQCTTGASCASGFCVDGVCCNAGCNGLCQACTNVRTGAANGVCAPIRPGTDPDNECTQQAAATCGTNGFCDGSGACQLYAAGTQCAAPFCQGTVAVGPATCNGLGTCPAQVSTNCAPYNCSAGACRTTCGTNTDCVSGYVCSGGACVAQQSACVGPPPAPANFSVSGCIGSIPSGSTCSGSCNPGFALSGGSDTVACVNGSWAGSFGTCVNVTTDFNNCGGIGQACSPTTANACVSGHCSCGGFGVCGGAQSICSGGHCVQCLSDANCVGTPGTPVCNTTANMCVQCNLNSDCPPQTPTCNTTVHVCS